MQYLNLLALIDLILELPVIMLQRAVSIIISFIVRETVLIVLAFYLVVWTSGVSDLVLSYENG